MDARRGDRGRRFNFLADLPPEQRFELPDGTRVLALHVAPGQNDGAGIHPKLTDVEVQALLAGASADLVCVGHTHWPVNRRVGGIRVINCGSVSNPVALDLRASYALLEATRRVPRRAPPRDLQLRRRDRRDQAKPSPRWRVHHQSLPCPALSVVDRRARRPGARFPKRSSLRQRRRLSRTPAALAALSSTSGCWSVAPLIRRARF